eukprot:scaffold89706_cov72-Phaeocystis_antarctica.AAC.1
MHTPRTRRARATRARAAHAPRTRHARAGPMHAARTRHAHAGPVHAPRLQLRVLMVRRVRDGLVGQVALDAIDGLDGRDGVVQRDGLEGELGEEVAAQRRLLERLAEHVAVVHGGGARDAAPHIEHHRRAAPRGEGWLG